jgi:hypothetical protein
MNPFNSRNGSPSSLLHMNMGMDLSQGGRSGSIIGDNIQASPLSLSLSSSLSSNFTNNNPAKRRKKDNPRRLDILPTRSALPIPVFNSNIIAAMGGGGGGVDGNNHGQDDDYDAEPQSDDEMIIHEHDEPVQLQQHRTSLEVNIDYLLHKK